MAAIDIDPVALTRDMIRCPSVTPADAGALDRLQAVLEGLGFTCRRLPFETPGTDRVDNLYARIGRRGTDGRNFCFAGHTDVVPVGDRAGWTVDPFGAEIHDGVLYGRGASDMKSAIAAFVAAAERFLARRGRDFGGAISLLITGDEEGPSVNGTVKVLDQLARDGERLDACVVGEPTNPTRLGEMMKIGRRGSVNAWITTQGAQGHVAYPHLADNPIPRLVRIVDALTSRRLDEGNAWFQPSNLEITSIDVGNPAENVIPAAATARLNIRFNDAHRSAELIAWIGGVCEQAGGRYELRTRVSGEAFLTEPGPLSEMVAGAIEARLGTRPELSTTGGTSDARFIRAHCPVVEFGLVGQTMHKVDERCAVADIVALADIYGDVLDRFFTR